MSCIFFDSVDTFYEFSLLSACFSVLFWETFCDVIECSAECFKLSVTNTSRNPFVCVFLSEGSTL